MPLDGPRSVTVAQAAAWLRTSEQKMLLQNRIRALARSMDNGTWAVRKHQDKPVHICDGELLNGHHRLWAVLLHGHPQHMWVREDVGDAEQ